MSNVSKSPREFIRFLCFGKNVDLDFKSRDVFSTVCDQYFLDKTPPSISSLVERTGYRRQTVKDCLAKLTKIGIWDGKRPLYAETVFLEKKDFRLAKWWKGLNSRKVTWQAKVTKERVARVDLTWKCSTVSRADRIGDAIWGFVQYTNRRAFARPVGIAYLRKCLGLDRYTTQKAVKRLVGENRLQRDDKLGLKAIEGKRVIVSTTVDKPDSAARQTEAALQPVQPPDLNPATHFDIKDILTAAERYNDLYDKLNRAFYCDTRLLNEVVISMKRKNVGLEPHRVYNTFEKVKRERRGF